MERRYGNWCGGSAARPNRSQNGGGVRPLPPPSTTHQSIQGSQMQMGRNSVENRAPVNFNYPVTSTTAYSSPRPDLKGNKPKALNPNAPAFKSLRGSVQPPTVAPNFSVGSNYQGSVQSPNFTPNSSAGSNYQGSLQPPNFTPNFSDGPGSYPPGPVMPPNFTPNSSAGPGPVMQPNYAPTFSGYQGFSQQLPPQMGGSVQPQPPLAYGGFASPSPSRWSGSTNSDFSSGSAYPTAPPGNGWVYWYTPSAPSTNVWNWNCPPVCEHPKPFPPVHYYSVPVMPSWFYPESFYPKANYPPNPFQCYYNNYTPGPNTMNAPAPFHPEQSGQFMTEGVAPSQSSTESKDRLVSEAATKLKESVRKGNPPKHPSFRSANPPPRQALVTPTNPAGVSPNQSKKPSQGPVNKKMRKPSMLCIFCRSNKEVPAYYTSHDMVDAGGKVVCPVLRRYVCELCGASGDNAHTKSYCPFNLHRRVGIGNGTGADKDEKKQRDGKAGGDGDDPGGKKRMNWGMKRPSDFRRNAAGSVTFWRSRV